MTTWVVGDLQGSIRALEALLDRVAFVPGRDTLWLVGDLVNRGGSSLAVLRRLHELRKDVVAVLGNHDLHLLRRAAGTPGLKSNAELDAVLAAPDGSELLAWLRRRPLLHVDRTRGVALAHAGIHPAWDLERAEREARSLERAVAGATAPEAFEALWGDPGSRAEDLRFSMACFTRMRFVFLDGQLELEANGPPASAPAGAAPWFAWPGRRSLPVHLYFGHWAALGFHRAPGATGLDSGYVWGGALTAVDVDRPERVVRIPAKVRDADEHEAVH